MLTTYYFYVMISTNVSTVQYRVELPLGSTRARTLHGMLLTQVWTLSRGSVAIDFGLQLPIASGSLTEGPIPPNHDQFRPKYVRLSSYTDDRGPNPCEWCLVHGGKHPLLKPVGVWHYHQPLANCCDTMPCHVEPSLPPELGDKRLQWHLIQNAQEGFSHMRDATPCMYRTASVSHITMCKSLFMISPTSLRTRIRLSIPKSMNRLSSQKMTCCHWPSGWLVCFWAQWRRTSLALTVNFGYFYHSPSPVGTRHQPPIHPLTGNCKIHVWLPCTPQPLYTESSVFPGKAIQHAVIPVISFTWSYSTPSTNKMSTFTESFDDVIDSVAMETNFSSYIPIWTSIPPIYYDYSSTMRYHRTHNYHVNMSTKIGHRRFRIKGIIVIMAK